MHRIAFYRDVKLATTSKALRLGEAGGSDLGNYRSHLQPDSWISQSRKTLLPIPDPGSDPTNLIDPEPDPANPITPSTIDPINLVPNRSIS